ncbi:tRNA lysidine(34) synthetase TilS [Qipengyuania sphaerica]|uniref:tRNA lysidine(34) synthetase TilS n=1 Tax=Qipengyuania sphaerica TaxID=2867243 RepID=UPI001C87976D|nr:tRNA lysidine(34) synthetase TilS [Qipengyuania sphaerica]MBX7539856.1 tRNA lysidine(34) synthetase TilS [Qipengyuania sphaerica]
MALDPELVERFRADLEALWLDFDEPDAKLGVAFSGGPDSLALLLLAAEALPGRVEAASVDHGLRPESAAEVEHAAGVCARLQVPHEGLRIEVPQGNTQSEARKARYAALSAWAERRDIDTICTAHHRDDQVETFLMRLNRGSGLSGLAGVRAAGLVPDSEVILIRPLLGWDRASLERILAGSGFDAVQDSSNTDPKYDRVRMRDALADADWIDRGGVARSAQVLAEMEDSILGLAAEDLELAGSFDGETTCYRPLERSQIYRPAVWGEIIVMIFDDLGRKITRSDAVRMAETLMDEQPLNIGGVHAVPSYEYDEMVWTFAPENPRKTG